MNVGGKKKADQQPREKSNVGICSAVFKITTANASTSFDGNQSKSAISKSLVHKHTHANTESHTLNHSMAQKANDEAQLLIPDSSPIR